MALCRTHTDRRQRSAAPQRAVSSPCRRCGERRHALAGVETRAGPRISPHKSTGPRWVVSTHSIRDSRRYGALAMALFAKTDVLGFEQMIYALTPDAIELGLDAALPRVFELRGSIGCYGRGERT